MEVADEALFVLFFDLVDGFAVFYELIECSMLLGDDVVRFGVLFAEQSIDILDEFHRYDLM